MDPSPQITTRYVEFEYEFRFNRVQLGLSDRFEPIPLGEDGRFEIHAFLGRGTMGSVYRAYDKLIERDVAVKIVALGSLDQAQLRERLQREAKALAQVRHENVLVVHDVGRTGSGELFIATDYVRGVTLDEWQRDRSLHELLPVYLDAARGLAAVHARGIVHRDFKPHNVLIGEQPRRVIIGDFGLAASARVGHDGPEHEPLPPHVPLAESVGVGTAGYMPPEQQRGTAEPRSDQYAFCVALWEAVTGARPFAGVRDPSEETPARPVTMPRWLYRVLDRGLDPDPQRRYASMDELLRRLEWFVSEEQIDALALDQWQRDRDRAQLIAIYRAAALALIHAHERGRACDFDPQRVFVSTSEVGPRLAILPETLAAEAGADVPDTASDQRAFCAALWEAFADAPPSGPSPHRHRKIPRWLYAILRRGLATDPEQRFETMAALLERFDRRMLLRRIRPLGAGAAALAGLGLALSLLRPQPCAAAADPVDDVWNPELRAEVADAIRTVDSPYAWTMADFALGSIDESTQRWRDQARSICRDRQEAPASPEVERRAQCLERWLARIEGRVERLLNLDADTIEHIFEWLEPLRSANDICQLPPPILAEDVQEAIDASEDAESIDDVPSSISWAREAVARATRAPDGCRDTTNEPGRSPELGYAQLRLGQALASSEPREAFDSLARARQQALACDDHLLYVDAQLRSTEVLAIRLEQSERARATLADADAMSGRLGHTRLRDANREKIGAQVQYAAGEYAAARASYQRSLMVLGDQFPARATKLHHNIAVTYLRENELSAAMTSAHASFETIASALGPEHPAVIAREARLHFDLGQIALESDEPGVAIDLFTWAADTVDPELATKARTQLIIALEGNDETARALIVARELITLIEAHPKLADRTRAEALMTAGSTVLDAGDPSGIEHLQRAHLLWQKLDQKHLLLCEYYLASGHAQFGRVAEARSYIASIRQSEHLAEAPGLREAVDEFALALDTEQPRATP